VWRERSHRVIFEVLDQKERKEKNEVDKKKQITILHREEIENELNIVSIHDISDRIEEDSRNLKEDTF
jgi:hypothetical protein